MNSTALTVWQLWCGANEEGSCNYCRGLVVFDDYGNRKLETGWEIEHSVALANGGSWSLNNLKVACWRCNAEKGHRRSARQQRRAFGFDAQPLTFDKAEAIRDENRTNGMALGTLAAVAATIAFGIAAPVAIPLAAIGLAVGGTLGMRQDPHPR